MICQYGILKKYRKRKEKEGKGRKKNLCDKQKYRLEQYESCVSELLFRIKEKTNQSRVVREVDVFAKFSIQIVN